MDIKNITWKLLEKWKNIKQWFEDITNYMLILDYIKNAKNISVIWHDKIDGDSLGSVLAVSKWLKNKFPDKQIISYTNRKPSSVFDFLNPEIQFGEDLKLDENTDLFIILDSANLDRLWNLYTNNKELIETKDIINIDHHISNTNFWKVNIVEWNSPATAQIIYKILTTLEGNINNLINQTKNWFDQDISTYLLIWILTDTNNFTIPLADDKTLEIASNLIKKWADKQLIIDKIFQSKSVEQLKLQGLVLNRIQKIEKDNIISYFSYYTEEDFIKLWLDPTDSWIWRALVSILNQIDWADFVSLWKIKENDNSISFRSKKFDVNSLANKLWWWGHKNAAWASLKESIKPEEIENKIKELINN